MRVKLPDQAEDVAPVAAGQLHVDEDDPEGCVPELLGQPARVMGERHAVAPVAEDLPQVLAQLAVIVHDEDPRLALRPVDQVEQPRQLDRLREHVPDPGPQGLLRRGAAGVGRDEDGDGPGAELLDLAVEGQAVHARHPEVQEHDVVGPLVDELESRRAVIRAVNPVAEVGEDVGQVVAGIRLVVDDEHPRFVRTGHEATPSLRARERPAISR